MALPLPPLTRRERTANPAGGVARRLGAFVVALPDHHWLDRLVRGRAWIPVLGILLAGIVATQVEILKLGAGMGQAVEQTTTLTSQNEQLRDSVARLGDDQRIERLAHSMGMVLPPPGAVGYLAAGPGGNVGGALANIHSPDPSGFVALTPRDGDGALVTGAGTSTLPPLPGAPAPPPAAPATGSSATAAAGMSTSGAATASGASASGTSASGTSTSATSTSATSTVGSSTASSSTSSTASLTSTTSPTTSQVPTTTGQTPSQTSTVTPQTGLSNSAAQTSQAPATGAAAIQPASSGQQSGGG